MDDDFDFTKPAAAPAPAAAPPKPAPVAAPAPASATPPAAPSAPAAPSKSKFYNAAIAQKLFAAFGTAEKFPAGGALFVEHEKASKGGLFSKAVVNRMFFLNSGDVVLSMGGKMLDTIKPGEIFGEMAVITGGTRSASATAKIDCEALSLDVSQFQKAIQQMPEFALMLMSVMFDRLRLVAMRLAARKSDPGRDAVRDAEVFDQATLAQLQDQIEQSTVLRFPNGKAIMQEGEAGVYMYVVVSGRVSISIKGNPVESVAVGGTFGEMALVDQSARTASAHAAADSELLVINRAAMLKLVKQHPEFGVALLRAVANRLRHMNSLLG